MSSNLKVPKKCIYCGKRFIASTFTTKYCSHQCNQRHYKELKKAEKVHEHLALNNDAMEPEKPLSPTPQPSNVREFLSIEEAAELLGVSARTIMRQIGNGAIRAVKIGRRTMIARAEIDKLFN